MTWADFLADFGWIALLGGFAFALGFGLLLFVAWIAGE